MPTLPLPKPHGLSGREEVLGGKISVVNKEEMNVDVGKDHR